MTAIKERQLTAQRISKLMYFTHTSNKEVADKCGISPGAVSLKKTGRRSFHGRELAILVNLFRDKGMNVDLDYLVGLPDAPPDAPSPTYTPKENALFQVGA